MDLLERSKKEISDKATADAVNIIEEGQVNILKKYLSIKTEIDYLTTLANILQEHAITEFEMYGEKELDLYGRKLSIRQTGVIYDYKNCGYSTLNNLQNQQDTLKASIKEAQDFLKYIKPNIVADSKTGEFIEPPIKTSKTSLIIAY